MIGMFDRSPNREGFVDKSERGDDYAAMTCMTDMVFQLLIVFILGLGVASGVVTMTPGLGASEGDQRPKRGDYVDASVEQTAAGYRLSITASSEECREALGEFVNDEKGVSEEELFERILKLLARFKSMSRSGEMPAPPDFRLTYLVREDISFQDGLAAYGEFRTTAVESGLVQDVYVETIPERKGQN